MSTPRFQHYSFGDVTAAFGPIILDGYQDGEGITIEHTSDAFTLKVGIDGKATRCKVLDRSATITIKLMQSSAANDLLSAVYLADQAAPNGAGVGPFIIRDHNGRSVFTAAESWIARAPDATFDQEVSVREWKFGVAFLSEFHGGN
jgi:hypothetical protein